MNKLQLTSAKTALITLGLLFCLPFAQETNASADSRQKAIVSALDSIEENVIGFAMNGRAKGGILSSILNSDALPESESVSEHLAFTDFLLNISVRPSKETKATFDLRFHKDWQNAYREGNNSPAVRWWSYDGNILDKKLKFNLGTIRLAYTPLTIYLPEADLIMEPDIFYALKREAMEDRYLDGTNRRLLQGLNAEYKNSVGIFDNIFLQGTIARLYKNDDIDRVAYDIDHNKDRYSVAARIGVEMFGFSLGANDVYTFDRVKSSIRKDSLKYENNKVLSFELGYSSKKLLPGPLSFGANAEYALSTYETFMNKSVGYSNTIIIVDSFPLPPLPSYTPVGPPPSGTGVTQSNKYIYYGQRGLPSYKLVLEEEQKNKSALLVNAFAAFNQSSIDAKISGHFLNVDEYFESELAASPAYLPNMPILNSNANLNSALEQFRAGSLENMYYSLYYSLPMNAITTVVGASAPGSIVNGNDFSSSTNLYNNYKFSHYYRNAYTQQTYTRLDRANAASRLDPAVNLALPYGYATPDRTGGGADLNFAWNKAVNIRGMFGKYSSENADYTHFGGGTEVNVARLAGLGNDIVVSGSYEHNKEENGEYNPQVNRIMAGLKIGIWRGVSFMAGFQQLVKEFENPYLGLVDKTSELLAIGGPQIKISEKANFSLQGGLLSNTIEGGENELKLDKYLVSGIVTVEF